MKGLKEYIARHGRHFTESLAVMAVDGKWCPSDVEKTSETMVYYNVSEATLGDMVFLVNLYNIMNRHASKRACVKYAIDVIGDVTMNGYAFSLWLTWNNDVNLYDFI